MAKASEMLRQKYDAAREERDALVTAINERIMNDGESASEDERKRLDEMQARINERKEGYEAQRDFEFEVEADAEYSRQASAEAAKVRERSEETIESLRRAARDVMGPDGLRDYDQRAGQQLATFTEMGTSRGKRQKLTLNPQLSHNLEVVRSLGVDPSDYVGAAMSGRTMVAERGQSGEMDVRVYNATTAADGGALVPTFWDESLYRFASWIGGVQAAGAEIIPLTGNNALKLPKITGYEADALKPRPEGETVTHEVRDTVGDVTLTPRPYRGFSVETDELMKAALIDTRMLLVLRGLARALTKSKERDFHWGTGAGEPKGVLHDIPASRVRKTEGNTTNIRYEDVPNALGLMDADYHMGNRPGSIVSLMHSRIWFSGFVGAKATDGHPLYPHLANGGRLIFGTTAMFSSEMAAVPAKDATLACVGNFLDGYIIGTVGGTEIEVTDDARFLEWERTYRIQEYCDGQIRDDLALTYIQSKA